ncbi:hypothetical protein D9757_007812 [Collybiopsis confluens]|uniref:Uncharacterized protein n=1 Tax=Collybiopsis confluens TaxID=2823264 RepID=A0A8H5HQ80_9AGAR|nr:hypothetical protein D9757_007812 [Collybiopsis confluens]
MDFTFTLLRYPGPCFDDTHEDACLPHCTFFGLGSYLCSDSKRNRPIERLPCLHFLSRFSRAAV